MVENTKWRLVCLVCAAIMVEKVLTSQELLIKLSKGFGKGVEECKAELKVGDHVIEDFMNFWREEYKLLNKDFGCMILCMAKKLDLIDENMKMHHGNAHEFAKTHGADDDTAKQLVTILHDCETAATGDDPCEKSLEAAKCFRTKMHELKWAPTMEVLLEELMVANN